MATVGSANKETRSPNESTKYCYTVLWTHKETWSYTLKWGKVDLHATVTRNMDENIVEFFWNSPIKYRWEIECNSHVLAFEGHFTKPCVRLWSSISYVIYVVMSMVSKVTGADLYLYKSIRLRKRTKSWKNLSVCFNLFRASQVQHPFLLIQHSHHQHCYAYTSKIGGKKKKFSRIGSLLVFVKTNVHLINTERLQFSDMYTSMHFWVCYFFCSEIIFFYHLQLS